MSNYLKKFGLLSLILLSLASLLFVYGCGSNNDDDPFSRTEEVNVPLGSFDLTGGSGQQGSLSVHAALAGNPVCGRVSMDDLLSDVSTWLDLSSIFDRIEIEQIRYHVITNNSTEDVTARLQMEDPSTSALADVASVSIPMGATPGWTTLPFAAGGSSILNHYLDKDNLGDSFDFCAAGSPDTSALSLTVEIELDVNVTVSVL